DHETHHEGEQHRPQQRPHHQGIGDGLAVAQVLHDLFQEYGQGGLHAISPSSLPIALTKASSRLLSPVCARSWSALPSATTRPWAMITMWSHSAATSCMMWLENSTQRPSSRRRCRKRRMARVAITSR